RALARARPRGRHLLHAVLPAAGGAARDRGLSQPLVLAARRGGHRRPPRGPARDRGGRDDGRRTCHAASCRVSLRLRGSADDAGRRHVRGAARPRGGGPGSGGAPVTEPILSRHFAQPEARTLAGYRARGGYEALKKALALGAVGIAAEVKKANLRGLGGAGFPTATKWGFIPQKRTGPVYLVVNADEGEPGTFKDRYILERDPHALVEGMLIAAYAIGCHTSFIYIRGEYVQPWQIFSEQVRAAEAEGVLGATVLGSGFEHRIIVHRGAGAYICGEETGLISSLEGKKGWPKVKPPFPAIKGAFGQPTVVNNVETLCCVPPIIERGAAWFAGLGTKTQGGTRMYSVSGRVGRPAVYEAPVSVTLRQLIYEHAGGVSATGQLKAVVPGG